MIDPTRIAVVLSSAAAPVLASEVFADEHLRFTAMLVATVAVVAGLIAWIDSRMKGFLKSHEDKENELQAMRHSAVMAEIRHLRRELRLPEEREITDPMGRVIYP